MNREALEEHKQAFLALLARTSFHQQVSAGSLDRQGLKRYLERIYHFVKATSETLLHAACAVSNSRVRDYLYQRAADERKREELVCDDYLRVGGERARLERSLPLPIVQAYVSHFREAGARKNALESLGAIDLVDQVGRELFPRMQASLLAAGFAPGDLSFFASHSDLGKRSGAIRAVIDSLDDAAFVHVLRGAELASSLYIALHDTVLTEESVFDHPYDAAAVTGGDFAHAIQATAAAVLREVIGRSRFLSRVASRELEAIDYTRYLDSSARWLEHSAVTCALLATQRDVRWPNLIELLWSYGREKEQRQLIMRDLRALGSWVGHVPMPWMELFIDWLYDASRRAPFARLGFLLLLERHKASLPRDLPGQVDELLGQPTGQSTRFLAALVGRQSDCGAELWSLLPELELAPRERDEVHYGMVVGGFLYSRIHAGSEA
jgi:thiaminase